ncbi:type II secretion system F family protein [Vibrio sp. HN007]|uniref:type II secretion system F family protein n=1 Tax=Vibrio iocasae TaxID=3098914 RepID=UPI0035D4619B
MEQINQFLATLNIPGLDRQVVFLIVVLVAAILFFVSIGLLIMSKSKSPIKKKLEEYAQHNDSKARRVNKLENTLESLSPVITPKDKKEKESVRHQLMHAGYHQASALSVFYAIKTLLTLIGVGAAVLVWLYVPKSAYTNIYIGLPIAIGLFSPNVFLNKMVKKRVRKLRAAVPDALDLLVVCTESGLGFNAALQRVANELVISHPDFADELDTVCVKLKAGIQLPDAFGDLITRTGLEELRGLVSMLSHAARIGGSLAQTLRDYTEDYRDKRQQEAEEIAAKIPTKMLFPMIIFIWPCFFIVAIGPGIMLVAEALK